MSKIVKNQPLAKVKKPSKKVLLAEISALSGRSTKELDSLGRSNIETIAWVKDLLS